MSHPNQNILPVENAFIALPDRANDRIFGRSVLERLMINCQRVGIKRFFVRTGNSSHEAVAHAAKRLESNPDVTIVDCFEDVREKHGLDGVAPVAAFSGNLVFPKSHLARLVGEFETNPGKVVRLVSTDSDRGGEIAIGRLGNLNLERNDSAEIVKATSDLMPFALNGRPEDRQEAELRLARTLREETVAKDAPLARAIDRKISWRLSYRLANTAITPNQVTIANTFVGLTCAWLFSMPSYWIRLAAALIFLISITIDGVDGELARLKMCESDFGGKLDMITDNIVHVALFIGLFTGCYRASQSSAYLMLIPIVLIGFASCAASTFYAFRMRGAVASSWLDKVDRWSGRDFGYLLVVLAVINRLEWFAWGTAVGTYVFAIVLAWLATARRADAKTT